MKLKAFFQLLLLAVLLNACSLLQKSNEVDENIVLLPEVEVAPEATYERRTEAMVHDLIHTRLDIKPIWKNRTLKGKAELRLKPYFYPSNELVLDAKAMKINSVSLKTDSTLLPLNFKNTGLHLEISLDRTYSRWEEYTLVVDYLAQPDSVQSKNGSAITDNRGLYFINPDSTEVNKPTQLWTQGETESSSCWFPTIDQPNERMTQEIYINVEEEYQSLSNGTLVYSNYLDDGTRTDYWKQDLSHAPYLAMLAVGDFIRAVSNWESPSGRIVPVHYYVEREYGDYAFKTFGNTPEMMSFYSELLDYEFPWDKYAQVVVRDYVSGAMENTSAVIFGDFMQQTDREMLDGDYEEVIAHELFHHWFGDVITCESWSHLAMNESFATYGEYLWEEHKYGRAAADYHLWDAAEGYFNEAEYKQVPIVRFDYADPDDMFDAHSYNKGGHVLHMLRSNLGDSAFFEGMSLYLKRNEFQEVETNLLRLAMEEVSGLDLTNFFDQWFFRAGHPKVKISYFVAEDTLQLAVGQQSSLENMDLFEIQSQVRLYFEKGEKTLPILVQNQEELFNYPLFDASQSAADLGEFLYAEIDPKGAILWELEESKPKEWWYHQAETSPAFLRRLDALDAIRTRMDQGDISSMDLEFQNMLSKTLDDEHWYIAFAALLLGDQFNPQNRLLLEQIALSDKNTTLRSEAIALLPYELDNTRAAELLKGLLNNERSYMVLSSALTALQIISPTEAATHAKKFENEDNVDLQSSIAWVYYTNNPDEGIHYTIALLDKVENEDQYDIGSLLLLELEMEDVQTQLKHAPIFEKMAVEGEEWWNRYLGFNALQSTQERLLTEAEMIEDIALKDRLELEAKKLKTRISELKEKEENQELLYYLED